MKSALSSKDKAKKAPTRDKEAVSVKDSTIIAKQKKDATEDQEKVTKQRKKQTEKAAPTPTQKELQGQVQEKERPKQTERTPVTIEKTQELKSGLSQYNIVAKVTRGLGLMSKSSIGHGFSVGELKNAGLGIDQARKLSLFVDTRRQTIHDDNVVLLKARVKLPKPTS